MPPADVPVLGSVHADRGGPAKGRKARFAAGKVLIAHMSAPTTLKAFLVSYLLGHGLKENQSTLDENARHGLPMGPEVLRGMGEEDNVKSSRIIMSLLALAFSKLPRPSATRPLRSQKKLSGDDHAERGDAKMWLTITLVSVVLIGVLLAISGPALAALLSQVMEKFG